MDEWDAQKMLDLYIHDYLVRKNMHTTADILAQEADIEPKSVAINPPEGFLSEWWSIFWDMYSSRLAQHSPAGQASTSQPTPNAETVQQNPLPPVQQNPLQSMQQNALPPMPDVNFMLQNMHSPMPRAGMPSLMPTVNSASGLVNPSSGPRPEFTQNAFPPMVPKVGFGPTRFGPSPASHSNLRQEQSLADLVAEKVTVAERPGLPPRSLDQFARMLPSGSSSSYRKKNKRQLPVPREINIGGLRPTTSELNLQAPKFIQDNADPGRKVLNKSPSEGCSLHQGFGFADFFPATNQQGQFLAPSASFRPDSTCDLAGQASEKLIISAPESLAMMVNPVLLDGDSSKGKGLQVGTSTETEKPMEDDIDSFFSNDETPEDMSTSFAHTLPQSSSAQQEGQQQDFPFREVRSLHPTNNKLSCCDFSANGRFLAAAGHEKKVFIWNLKQSNRQIVQGHTQLITDVRFKPSSNMLATSSFDRTVKIWDAANPRRALYNLVGHSDQVMSVDFHPRKLNLLASCDCSEEIRLWNVKESACFRTFRGANKQVRFQPRQGNLLAAATGNVICLIDIETGIIQHRFEGHENDVRSMCWDVCGDYLVSVSEESTRIWSLVNGGKSIYELPSVGRDFASCTFHPGFTQVVAVGSYKSIYIWNPTMGNKSWNFPAHQGIISGMANAQESNTIATVSHDQWIRLWK